MRPFFRTAGVWLLSGTTMLLTLLTPAAARAAEAAKTKASEAAAVGGFSSVLVKYRDEQKTFAQTMEKIVEPQMAEIRESFRRNIDQAEQLLREWRKNPSSRALASSYEETLSKALTELAAYLGTFAECEDDTIKALQATLKTAGHALSESRNAAAAKHEEAGQLESKAREIDDRLKEIAVRVAPLLDSDQPLPSAMDAEVQKLKGDLLIARLAANVSERAAVDAEDDADKIEEKLDSMENLAAKLSVAFHQARSQSVLVKNVAAWRHDHIMRTQLLHEMTTATNQLDKQHHELDNLSKAMEQMLAGMNEEPSRSDSDKSPMNSLPKFQAGADILKQYLTNNNPTLAENK